MLCLWPASTPRAPHQQPSQQHSRRAPPRLASSSSSSLPAPPPPPPPLRNRRRRSPTPTTSALPHGAERGDGVIPAAATTDVAAQPTTTTTTTTPATTATSPAPAPAPPPPAVVTPDDLLREFEEKLQGDVKAVAATLTAVTGVIVYWRGVWSLLDGLLGDLGAFGDVACIVVGLSVVLGVRLSGAKLSSFWPTS